MSDIDDRIQAALHAAADTVGEHDLRPATAPRDADVASHRRRRAGWAAPLLAAAAVIGVVAGSAALLSSSHGSRPPATTLHTSAPRTATPSATPPRTATPSARPPRTTPPVTLPLRGLVPLWPFTTLAEAARWETVDGPAGHSPWHADPATTALLFTENELGFTDITTVTSTVIDAHGDAHVGVGYLLGGQRKTAAVLHLARYGADSHDARAPWEVVGSDDTTLTLEQPAYGATVSSPMTVGGHITGVDESITVTVRTLTGIPQTAAPLPAGGNDTPWRVTVSFGQHGVLIIVAATGGHVTQHERFAIQAARTA